MGCSHLNVKRSKNTLPYGILSLQSHPGGLLFTKFGGSQTALLDLAFPVMILFFADSLSLSLSL